MKTAFLLIAFAALVACDSPFDSEVEDPATDEPEQEQPEPVEEPEVGEPDPEPDAPAEDPEPETDPEPEPEPEPNQSPTVAITATDAVAESPVTIEVEASDPDDDELTITATVAGDTYTETPIIWTPMESGDYTITAAVSDGEYTTTAEMVITVAEKPWEPEPMTLYVLDADGDIYLSEVVTDPDRWSSRYRAFSGTVDLYNRDQNKPGPYPYEFVAGEPPEGV